MAERETQDTEVTLGTAKLLGIFLGLVVMCAVFFTLGYMLGRGSATSGRADIVNAVPSGGSPATKPSAGAKHSDQTSQPCVAGSPNCPPNASAPASSTPDASASKPATPETSTAPQPIANTTASSNNTKPPDQTASPASTKNAPSGTYMVQVAAVSKQEDAEILVAALRKKQYPVFISNNPGDPLFHILVGPFGDPKEAEAMRSRLISEGYNPIMKK